MSSRYSIGLNKQDFEKRYGVEVDGNYTPRYNAAPSQLLPVISNTSPGNASFFYWGQIPGWSGNKTVSQKLIHANIALMREKISFRRTLETSRCLIPADGFYIWKSIGRKGKIPYRVILTSGEAFSFAGIWEQYEDENDQTMTTFKVITTTANPVVGEIQDTMPVVLTRQNERDWLSDPLGFDELTALLASFPGHKMTKFTVSPKINSTEVDDPSLIQAAPAADQFGNYSLFD